MKPILPLSAAGLILIALTVGADAAPVLGRLAIAQQGVAVWLGSSVAAKHRLADRFVRSDDGSRRPGVFETDLGDTMQATILAKAMAKDLNPLGTTLTSPVDKAGATELRATVARPGMPVGTGLGNQNR